MEAQVVELTQEQLDAVLFAFSALETISRDCQTAILIMIAVSAFFIAFELAAFHFWKRVFRE